jgi:hypothetical protein
MATPRRTLPERVVMVTTIEASPRQARGREHKSVEQFRHAFDVANKSYAVLVAGHA